MKDKQLGDNLWLLAFAKDDPFPGALLDFVKRQGVVSATFTAIGAFEEATLGYFVRESADYIRIPVEEASEVASLTGNIAMADGQPRIHAHVVLGLSDGTALAGHLFEARVWPALELTLTISAAELHRFHDAETNLALLDFDR